MTSRTVAPMATHRLQFWIGKLGKTLDRECRLIRKEKKGTMKKVKQAVYYI